MTYDEFIKLATKYYAQGGDVYVECWSKEDYDRYCELFGTPTKRDALEMFRICKGNYYQYF